MLITQLGDVGHECSSGNFPSNDSNGQPLSQRLRVPPEWSGLAALKIGENPSKRVASARRPGLRRQDQAPNGSFPKRGPTPTARPNRKQTQTGAAATMNRPKQKWGPALLPAPTAPSTDMPVFVTRSAEASPSLDPGSPAQASLSIAAARESLAFSSFPSRRKFRLGPLMSRPKTKQLRCSTALLGMITSASRFASPTEVLEAASRKRKIISSGASSRLAPDRARRPSPLPAGRDRNFGHRRPKEAATAVPIT